MGKRSRKRGGSSNPREDRDGAPKRAAAATAGGGSRSRAQTPSRRARLDEAPKAAWHPLPITEVVILVGLVLLGIGFFDQDRGPTLLVGFVLVAIASGELALREHLAGYRSHSAMLAGGSAVVIGVVLAFAGVPQILVFGIGAAIAAVSFSVLRTEFKRRSGGLGFRV